MGENKELKDNEVEEIENDKNDNSQIKGNQNILDINMDNKNNKSITNEEKEVKDNQNNNPVYNRYYEKMIEQRFHPWASICTEPRMTIRYIINNQPRKHVLLLAIIYGILQYFQSAARNNMGDDIPMWGICLRAIVIGGLGGIVLLYILAGLIKWTGKLLKGKGTMEQIRAVIAWSGLPYIFVSVLWIPKLILFGTDLFKSSKPDEESLKIAISLFKCLYFWAYIWVIFLKCKCLKEVQEFSAWKAILNYLLTGLASFFLLGLVIFSFLGMAVLYFFVW